MKRRSLKHSHRHSVAVGLQLDASLCNITKCRVSRGHLEVGLDIGAGTSWRCLKSDQPHVRECVALQARILREGQGNTPIEAGDKVEVEQKLWATVVPSLVDGHGNVVSLSSQRPLCK